MSRGASNVRLAVATIIAIHVVFFGGLLLQGCKRDTKTLAEAQPETNSAESLTLPPIDTGTLYYPSPSSLPAESTHEDTIGTTTSTAPPVDYTATTAAPRDPWQPSNFGTQVSTARIPEAEAIGSTAMREHTVVPGDNFSKIAKVYGTTANAIIKANPGVEPTRIRPGMKIKVPTAPPTAAGAPSIQTDSNSGAVSGTVYTVKAGDNLTRIAQKHGVTVSQLRAANNLRTSRVNIGQKLSIPKPQNGQPNGSPTNRVF